MYGPGRFTFPYAKQFLRKLLTLWIRTVKIFTGPVLGRKILQNIGLKGFQINGAHMSPAGPAPNEFYLKGFLTFYVTFLGHI
jgi:hypothetical protein